MYYLDTCHFNSTQLTPVRWLYPLSCAVWSSARVAAVAEVRPDLPEQGEGGCGGQGNCLPNVRVCERVRDEQQPARVRGIIARERTIFRQVPCLHVLWTPVEVLVVYDL